jgi:hypothetical protein
MSLFNRKAKKISWDEPTETEDEEEQSQVEEELPIQDPVKKETVRQHIKSNNQPTHSRVEVAPAPRRVSTVTERLNRLNVNDRMDLMADVASSVIEGTIPCCLIGGDPGIGKTHTIVEELLKKKYKRVEHQDYLIIKAGVSAFGVYKLVVEWSEKAKQAKAEAKSKKAKGQKAKAKVPVIVFDDVPLWSEKRMVDLLKGLMDTSDRRIVSWLTDRSETDPEQAKKLGKLPAQVEYTGGVIVITNEDEKRMNKAVIDRTVYLPIEVSDIEMQERMKTLCNRLEPGMDNRLKQQVLNWILSSKYEGKERSMRTLVKALKLARANPNRWEYMVQVV